MTGRRSHGRLSALNGVVHQGSLGALAVDPLRTAGAGAAPGAGRAGTARADAGPRRWCADAGRPTRFKPLSPSPTDAVRDGSAKLGHPVQNVTRDHGLTPLPR